MRILGIDPGYGILGWSVIGDDLTVIQYGTITTDTKKSLDCRLADIHHGLNHIITSYSPTCAAIEKLYFARNTTTALDVARAIGVVYLTLNLSALQYNEYSPNQVKRAITGYGGASKSQMQSMVQTLFKLKSIPQPDDAADALAIAACHAFATKAGCISARVT
jgi:crossover junction endodeoxyribonuclease RuvC